MEKQNEIYFAFLPISKTFPAKLGAGPFLSRHYEWFIGTWFHRGHISIKTFDKGITCLLLAYMEMSYTAEAWWWIYKITETQYTIQLTYMEQRADVHIIIILERFRENEWTHSVNVWYGWMHNVHSSFPKIPFSSSHTMDFYERNFSEF